VAVQTILIVDDEFGVVDVLVKALEDEGYRVVVAANGKHALDRLNESKVDVVIADFMMPIMDGATLGRTMRSMDGFSKIPFVLTSALPEKAVAKRFDAYAAFLRKPFLASTLIDTVRTLLPER
jgi:CheY-like chemotaxis protein